MHSRFEYKKALHICSKSNAINESVPYLNYTNFLIVKYFNLTTGYPVLLFSLTLSLEVF